MADKEGQDDDQGEIYGQQKNLVKDTGQQHADGDDEEIICISDSEKAIKTPKDDSCKNKVDDLEVEEEEDDDDIVVEREIRLDPSGQVIVRVGGEKLVSAEKDSLNNLVDTDDVIKRPENDSCKESMTTSNTKEKYRSEASRSRSRSRSNVSKSLRKRSGERSKGKDGTIRPELSPRHQEKDDFIVVDCVSDDDGAGNVQDEGDSDDVEVIKSNLAFAERERRRRRSRSGSRSSRRRRRTLSRERSRSRSSNRSRRWAEDRERSRRERRDRERWEDSRQRRRDEERRDREWKDKSGAFLAKIGVSVDHQRGENGIVGPSYLDSLNLPSLQQLADLNQPPPHHHTVFDRRHPTPSPPPAFNPFPQKLFTSSNPGGSMEQRRNPSGGPSMGKDLDFRHSEVLRPGNYLLVTWDILPLGSGLKSSIYQLGARTAHGDTLVTCVFPATPRQRAEATLHSTCPLLKMTVGGKSQASVRHPTTGRFLECVGEREALQTMIDFLEKGRNRVRPAYDGVVLLSHLPEVIPQLLKSLRRWGLYNQFQRSVASLGDLSTYLSTVHHHRLKELGQGQQLNVSLEFAYERVTKGLKAKVSSSLCDRRAALIMELLERLLETPGSK